MEERIVKRRSERTGVEMREDGRLRYQGQELVKKTRADMRSSLDALLRASAGSTCGDFLSSSIWSSLDLYQRTALIVL